MYQYYTAFYKWFSRENSAFKLVMAVPVIKVGQLRIVFNTFEWDVMKGRSNDFPIMVVNGRFLLIS